MHLTGHAAPLHCGKGDFNSIPSSGKSDMGHSFKQNLLSFLKANTTLKTKLIYLFGKGLKGA